MTVDHSATRLGPIVADVRRRADARRAMLPLETLRREARPDPARRERFVGALGGDGLAIIAECKRRSPSAGEIRSESDWLARAAAYARGGAAAVSVLTEEDHFRGAPEDLAAVAVCGLPRLRKDFLLDEGMVLESLAWGADAVLLLPVILEPALLVDLAALARELGLATLVEVHAEAELDAALASAPDLLGVNARDLRTFAVDVAHVERLLPRIPAGPLRVAESGLRTLDDLLRVRAAGADAALVGEALMRSEDPEETLRGWLTR